VARHLQYFVAAVATFLLGCLVPKVGVAQHITVDGSLSAAQTLVGPNYNIGANLGKQVGGNLFQSFGIFGLSKGENATFSGPSSVANVIGRVTGGSVSSINGAINSSIAGANLYLINPSGIVFGPTATVNVSGSFHAASADYLRMSDGAKFQATNPSGSTLSAAAPVAFGFLTATPGAITVNGSALGVNSGQTIGLAGGPVSIAGANLSAPAGTIHVTSVASPGEIPAARNTGTQPTVTSYGAVSLTGGSLLNVSDPVGRGSGGSVYLRAGTLTIDASEVNADNYGSGPGGTILLRGDSQITLSDGAYVHAVAYSSGSGADVTISAGQLSLTGGALVESAAAGPGGGGNIAITVAGALTIDGSLGPPLMVGVPATGIASLTAGNGSGPAGNMVITASSLSIKNNGGIGSSTFGSGAAGNVTVTVSGQLSIDQTDASGFQLGAITGIGALGELGSTGKVGDVTITAGTLSLIGSGQIGSAVFGAGNGGSLSINVAGLLTVDGSNSTLPFVSGLFTSAQPGSTGNAGNLTVVAAGLSVLNDGAIFSGTIGAFNKLPASTGNGGDIAITVPGALAIDSSGAISTSTDTGTRGNAGKITVTAGSLSITNSGEIASSTLGSGNAGNITVTAGSLSITNSDGISSSTLGSGNAGNISVTAGTVMLSEFGGIDSDSFFSGAAGNISVAVNGTGPGALTILTNGFIAANPFGKGAGGQISVTVAGGLTIDGTSANPGSATGIVANAQAGSGGNAGAITVTAGNVTILGGGEISSSALGANPSIGAPAATGNAGSVTVIAGALSLMSGGFIGSNTEGVGNAGNIVIAAQSLSMSDGAEISSGTSSSGSTVSGAGGNIAINVSGDLTVAVSTSDALIETVAFGNTKSAGSIAVHVGGTLSLTGSANAIAEITADTLESSGAGGNVSVTAGVLKLVSGGSISSDTGSGFGAGGNVSVTVAGQLGIDGGAMGIADISAASVDSLGNAGNVSVTAGNLTIVNGGQITTSTVGNISPAKSGNGGNVSVSVSGVLIIDSIAAPNNITGIISRSYSGSSGNAGNVIVNTGTLNVADYGEISTSTAGPGNAGDVTVAVAGAGSGALTILNGGVIASNTFGSGNGGQITVTVAGGLTIDQGVTAGSATGIVADAEAGRTGKAGSVTVIAGNLSIANNGEISSGTFGPNNGGNVSVSVAGTLAIDSSSANPQFLTGVSAQTNPGSTGNGGDVDVQAGLIILSGPGNQITAQSFGRGVAGNLTLNAVNLQILDGAGISAQGAQAQGGNITVSAGDLLYLRQGSITTSSEGVKSNGGNITIGSHFVVLDQSSITANAFGGNGGNIIINSGVFIPSAESAVTASSQTGIAGTIAITGQETALNSSLVVLPSTLRSAAAILRDSCAARAGVPRSTLTQAGRGGLPQDPEATIPALYLAGRDVDSAAPKAASAAPARVARQSTLRLTMPCAD
jgi:filamentous hemagglutinin family protein